LVCFAYAQRFTADGVELDVDFRSMLRPPQPLLSLQPGLVRDLCHIMGLSGARANSILAVARIEHIHTALVVQLKIINCRLPVELSANVQRRVYSSCKWLHMSLPLVMCASRVTFWWGRWCGALVSDNGVCAVSTPAPYVYFQSPFVHVVEKAIDVGDGTCETMLENFEA
jgi:hypothetical protein